MKRTHQLGVMKRTPISKELGVMKGTPISKELGVMKRSVEDDSNQQGLLERTPIS